MTIVAHFVLRSQRWPRREVCELLSKSHVVTLFVLFCAVLLSVPPINFSGGAAIPPPFLDILLERGGTTTQVRGRRLPLKGDTGDPMLKIKWRENTITHGSAGFMLETGCRFLLATKKRAKNAEGSGPLQPPKES